MVWVLDLDGVVRLGRTPITGAVGAVRRLAEAGETVVYVTNNAATPISEQERSLEADGFPAAGRVYGAAAAAARLLEGSERVLVVGSSGLADEVAARGCTVVDEGPCDAVVCGLDRGFTYEKLKAAGMAIRAGARWIATNTDATFPTADGLEPGAGSIVAAITTASGTEPEIGGKPTGAMVELLRDELGAEGIVVGDRPDTDGLFARALGYEFALVLSGVTTADDLPVEPEPDHVADDLAGLVDERMS